MPVTRAEQLGTVIDETRRLFHRLVEAAERAHADLGITASQRGVLESLSRQGPQTVPQIARTKGVSRQHIQTITNALLATQHLEVQGNPAHERSPLIVLTTKGQRCFETMKERERAIVDELARHLRLADLETTAQTLRAIGEALESSKDGRLSAPR